MDIVKEHLDEFLSAYITAALWSTNDESDESGGEPLDKNYDEGNIYQATFEEMKTDCEGFLRLYGEEIEGAIGEVSFQCSIWAQAGHDFWLNRNGHGCGFWDGDWPEGLGKLLDHACKKFGEVYLYVHDGQIFAN